MIGATGRRGSFPSSVPMVVARVTTYGQRARRAWPVSRTRSMVEQDGNSGRLHDNGPFRRPEDPPGPHVGRGAIRADHRDIRRDPRPAHRVSRPRPGETWLDVATGTGPLALRAAQAGASVVGVDLAPALIATARQLAAAAGLRIAYTVGDCERLTHPAASFDVVVSSFGTIFAPDHAAVAAELARVCRPGGRLGLAAWQPGGGAARMTEVVMAFQPGPPSPGAGNPFDWGREEYVRSRLHEAFELEFLPGESPQIAPSAEAVWDLYVTSAGPVKALADTLPSDRREALRQAFVALVDAHRDPRGIRVPSGVSAHTRQAPLERVSRSFEASQGLALGRLRSTSAISFSGSSSRTTSGGWHVPSPQAW